MAQDYLGVGLKFPIEINQYGRPVLISGKALLEQSMLIILNTDYQTTFFLPEYGSRLSEMLFEPNDEVLKNVLKTFVYEALKQWEKRVSFVDVVFVQDTTGISLEIFYKILQSNEIDSFIFPFYKSLKY